MTSQDARLRTVLIALSVLTGCGSQGPSSNTHAFPVEFRINDDTGRALAGAMIRSGESNVGSTTPEGRLSVTIPGAEGQVIPIEITCPKGYRIADQPLTLRLAHARNISQRRLQPIRFAATCTRDVRDVVLLVRAQRGAGVTLLVNGKPLGVTTADGIAHVLVHTSRETKVLNVTLDTSEHEDLRPKNPSRSFELASTDSIVVFEQTFVAAAKPVGKAPRRMSHKHIPYRVD